MYFTELVKAMNRGHLVPVTTTVTNTKTGKTYQKKVWKRPEDIAKMQKKKNLFSAILDKLKEKFGFTKEKLHADYERENIARDYGANEKEFADHVLEAAEKKRKERRRLWTHGKRQAQKG